MDGFYVAVEAGHHAELRGRRRCGLKRQDDADPPRQQRVGAGWSGGRTG